MNDSKATYRATPYANAIFRLLGVGFITWSIIAQQTPTAVAGFALLWWSYKDV